MRTRSTPAQIFHVAKLMDIMKSRDTQYTILRWENHKHIVDSALLWFSQCTIEYMYNGNRTPKGLSSIVYHIVVRWMQVNHALCEQCARNNKSLMVCLSVSAETRNRETPVSWRRPVWWVQDKWLRVLVAVCVYQLSIGDFVYFAHKGQQELQKEKVLNFRQS